MLFTILLPLSDFLLE
uniref:Uncharacterized protein n=1 Tax=Anguilla anguilla TaxID=7936 RepID=A0A0E9TXD0_ANGAN